MKQITIVHEDRAGLLADISDLLANVGVNIESIDAESVGSTAIVSLIVDRYDDALKALTDSPVHAISEEALVVCLPDKPGELARLMHRFKEASLNLRSVIILKRDAGKAFVALVTSRTEEAINLVKDVLVS